MKKLILPTLAMAFVFGSCSANSVKNYTAVFAKTSLEFPNKLGNVDAIKKAEIDQSKFSINQMVNDYLLLKNALTKDDASGAAKAAKTLVVTLNAVNVKLIDVKLKKEYLDIADDAKENAEHIGDNAGKIAHQREHFVLLSKDINDLIKTFGSTQKLYQDFCPMANEGKGAIWISEFKEIKNPFYGKKMIGCGSIKKTI